MYHILIVLNISEIDINNSAIFVCAHWREYSTTEIDPFAPEIPKPRPTTLLELSLETLSL